MLLKYVVKQFHAYIPIDYTYSIMNIVQNSKGKGTL